MMIFHSYVTNYQRVCFFSHRQSIGESIEGNLVVIFWWSGLSKSMENSGIRVIKAIGLDHGFKQILNILIEPSPERSHKYGKSHCLIGKSTLNGRFSIAMLNYQKVLSYGKSLTHGGINVKAWEIIHQCATFHGHLQ